MRCLRSVAEQNMGEGFEKARTAYTLLYDVNKFASDSEHYSGKFNFYYSSNNFTILMTSSSSDGRI